jgi:hypothetical protein
MKHENKQLQQLPNIQSQDTSCRSQIALLPILPQDMRLSFGLKEYWALSDR